MEEYEFYPLVICDCEQCSFNENGYCSHFAITISKDRVCTAYKEVDMDYEKWNSKE